MKVKLKKKEYFVTVKHKNEVKRDIVRYYLTGKFTMESIMEKYGMESKWVMNRILTEVIKDVSEKKINSLF